MIYAEMTTEHFTFRALAVDNITALENIKLAWAAHMRQYGVSDWEAEWKEAEPPWRHYDVAYYHFISGIRCFRDYDTILGPEGGIPPDPEGAADKLVDLAVNLVMKVDESKAAFDDAGVEFEGDFVGEVCEIADDMRPLIVAFKS